MTEHLLWLLAAMILIGASMVLTAKLGGNEGSSCLLTLAIVLVISAAFVMLGQVFR